MEFGILGPLEVRSERGEVAVAGGKTAAILAVLLLHPNEPVSVERLAIALWGDDAPGGASRTVQVHVSRLRRRSATRDPDHHAVRVSPHAAGELDAARFEELVRTAGRRWRRRSRAGLGGLCAGAHAVARAAARRLRGRAFAPPRSRGSRSSASRRWRCGWRPTSRPAGTRDVVAELQHLVAEHPTREQLPST